MRIPILGFGQVDIAIELKDRGSFVQTAAVRHLMGSLTRAEGLRFAVVSFSIPPQFLPFIFISSVYACDSMKLRYCFTMNLRNSAGEHTNKVYI